MSAPHLKILRADDPDPGPRAGSAITLRVNGGHWRYAALFWPDAAAIPPCLRNQAVRADSGPGYFALIELG